MVRPGWFFVVLAASAGCHGAGSSGAPTPAPSATASATATPTPSATPAPPPLDGGPSPTTYRVRPVPDGHAVEVRLTYAGKPLPPWPIAAEFAGHCGGATSVPNPSLATDAKGGVTGAVVWIDDIHEGAPLGPSDPEVDQKGCVFSPHVLAVPAGTKIRLHNGDHANHAVRLDVVFDPDADEIMRMVPPGGADAIVSNPAWAGRVAVITCPIHPWMLGWVRFFDHPYYAVTTDGVARIEQLPPGTWHLSVWHEALDARATSKAETIRERPWTQARFEVTVADHDVVKTLTLGADGKIR